MKVSELLAFAVQWFAFSIYRCPTLTYLQAFQLIDYWHKAILTRIRFTNVLYSLRVPGNVIEQRDSDLLDKMAGNHARLTRLRSSTTVERINASASLVIRYVKSDYLRSNYLQTIKYLCLPIIISVAGSYIVATVLTTPVALVTISLS